MPKIDEKIIIFPKVEELLFYSKNMINKYPKHERYSLCDYILKSHYDCLKYIYGAYKEKHPEKKIIFLEKMDVELLLLKTNIKLSYQFKYITANNFKTWNFKIDEIGKMLGGWIKSCQKENT